MADPFRLLIVTAAFGEGHNSAARNLAVALEKQGAEARVCDPCLLGAPRMTRFVSEIYRLVTTHLPRVWARVYQSTDRCDFSRPRLPLLRPPERCLARQIEEFRPHGVVSTYPLYPYFLERIFKASGKPLPVFTVITDSIEINASWLKAPTTFWLVTDPHTRDSMIAAGLSGKKIVDTGFAVNPVFSELQPIAESDPCDPFRVLYFPTANPLILERECRAILKSSPRVKLTLVMGRNTRLLRHGAMKMRGEFRGRVKLVGWTRRVPQLLNRHHLIVGKAGGATVHEAIAARCPMLINHLVPGQEEGNLRLLETIGGGGLADSPEKLTTTVARLLADEAAGWRAMKRGLITHGRNAGGLTAARFILEELSDAPDPHR